MMVSKNAKICVTPNASQWNIGCVGSQTQISQIGHVHSSFFVLISFTLGPVFHWNMGLTLLLS